MGGPIGLTINDKDNKTITVEGYTNSLPLFIDNIHFVTSNLQYIKKHFSHYIDSKMPLAPNGYGLVAIDINSKTVLSTQGYCSFGSISFISLSLYSNDKETMSNFESLFNQGYIKSYRARVGNGDDWTFGEFSLEGKSLLDVKNLIPIILNDNPAGAEFIVKSDWTMLHYEEDFDGYEDMREKMFELGFTFTEQDHKVWIDYMVDNEMVECED